MKIWGNYDNLYILLAATLGVSIGMLMDYMMGIVLYKIFLKYNNDENTVARYEKIKGLFNKYGNNILCLSFVPYLGKFIPLIAGFTKYSPARTLILSIFSKACYYFFLIYKG